VSGSLRQIVISSALQPGLRVLPVFQSMQLRRHVRDSESLGSTTGRESIFAWIDDKSALDLEIVARLP